MEKMKTSDLIALLQTIPADADVLTPVDKNSLASEFKLTKQWIIYNVDGTDWDDAPHSTANNGDPGAVQAYVLDGIWTKVFDMNARKKRKNK